MRMIKTGGAIITAAVLLGACGPSLEAAGNIQQGPASTDSIPVEMQDNVFLPEEVRAKPGEEVALEITNAGRTVHNLVIEDLGISSGLIEAGEVVTATFTMPESKTEFVCTLHRGMVGELVPYPSEVRGPK
ncbi:MAG: cupredoxin domain-containing protein [Actinomycetota bacterium]